MVEKIKPLASSSIRFKDIRPETYTHGLMVAIIILTATASFGLGKLSALHSLKKPIVIENTVLPLITDVQGANTAISQKVSADTALATDPLGQVVASKTGDKYHLPTCAGAKSISAKNKIVFASIAEARKAGYLPAGNCKGLK